MTGGSHTGETVEPLVHEAFAAWAAARPEALAVAWSGGSLTYGELNARANRLARHLRRLGLGPEAPVGLLARRSPEMMVGLLGVLKAGGCYLPLDPAYPEERLAMTLADAGVRWLLSTGELMVELPAVAAAVSGRMFLLDEDWASLFGLSAEDPEPLAGPRHLAYVIYTSGSTGRPKGVEVEHRSLSNLVAWHRRTYGVTAADRSTRLAGSAFDASVWEIWPCLASGASLHLPPDELLVSPPELAAWLAQERITLCFLPTPLAEAVLEAVPGESWPAGAPLRALHTGGDRLHRGPDPRHPFGLYNHYGPTENTVVTTWCRVAPEEDGRPPIGRPLDGVEVQVVDPGSFALIAGDEAEAGELWAGGVGLARGYRGRPELTAERFVPDPFGSSPGARLYRTGDLVRTLPSGNLDFLGRIDFQVKVRGFRIELGEIETVLRRQAAVREGVVLAQEDGGGGRRLVGYVVPRGALRGEELTTELAAALGRSLPEYMVPATWVVLESLPLTPNGKVDRAALPEPERDEGSYVAPRSETEERLAAIFVEVLDLDRVGVDDDFFALGGHSLKATQALSRMRSRLRVDLPPRALFDHPTVARLAREVEASLDAAPGEGWEIRPVPRPESETFELPVSFSQQGLWLADRLSPGSPLYNTPFTLEIAGRLDAPALARVLAEIVRRHEPLRTTFRAEADLPVQVVARRVQVELPVVDLSGLPAAARGQEGERLAIQEALRPFDLARGPVMRLRLLRLGEGEHVLLALMHHIVTDDWSVWVFVSELAALYGAFSQGRPSPLPEPALQYGDFAAWQRSWLQGATLERQTAWWREGLRPPLPVLDLPADRPRPAVRTARGGRLRRTLPRRLADGLSARAQQADATLFIALLAVFDVLLCRYTGENDVLVGSPIANRHRVEVEGLIGYFVNVLALRGDLSGNPGFAEILGRLRETVLGAYEHQDLPFERLVEELAPVRGLSRGPLVDAFLILGNAPRPPGELVPGVRLALRELETGVAKADLSLFLEETGEGLAAVWEYSADLFDEPTVERMAGHLETLAAALVAAPESPVLDLPLLSAAERAQLASWNAEASARPGAEVPSGATLHGLFAAQAARTPDRVALIAGEERVSYAALAARATELAARMRGLGVGPEVGVGIFLDRSAELTVALLATLEAGGFYVPLDPAYPAERVGFMLADSGCAVVLTRTALEEKLPAHRARVVLLDVMTFAAPSRPALPAGPRNLAYLIYTSGSTGRPKAVAIEHRSAVARARWARREYSPLELSGVLASTSITFDMSVFEIFVPLAWGGMVILAENALALPLLPARGEVRLVDTVPSAIAELLRAGGVPPSVVTVNLGGEALPRSLADQVYAQPGIERLYNLYGPSEDTTFSTWSRVERESDRAPGIGRPLDGTQGWVLDARLSPAPVGVPGELHLGGEGLSRGYLGRPELTAERYVPDPFAAAPGARMYRTGDLACYRPDGSLDYLGRIDHQVKVRGFRVELDEVAAALGRLDGVEAAVVLAREDAALGLHLAAYVVPAAGALLEVAGLREGLRARLPEHMVPAAWKVLEALPLTVNGKVDRRALSLLPADFGLAGPAAGAELAPPRGLIEKEVAALFAEILGLERVGAHDNFFELGGHSLLVTRILSRVRRLFSVELPMRALFEQPTVAALVRRIAEVGREEGTRTERPEPPLAPRRRDGAIPLSFGQERLWFLDRLDPGRPLYNMPWVFRLRGPVEPGAAVLEAALGEVIRRHEALRTTFAMVGDAPAQAVAPPAFRLLPIVDLSGLPVAALEAEAGRLARQEAVRPFDLAQGPLLRAALLRLAEADHRLLLSLHHIVADGWSMEVLLRELATLHGAFAAGRSSPLPELPVQYPDFALWQREWLSGAVLEAQLAYWRQRLAGGPPALDLPADRPRPASPSQRGAIERLELPTKLAGHLQELSRRQGTTLYMTLLAAFVTLLHRYTGVDDMLVGSPVANRGRAELEGLIGFFVNTVVLRSDLTGDPAFGELLLRVRETALGAYAHQDLPFEKLVGELAPGRDLARSPFFQTLFMLQDAAMPALALTPGLALEGESGAGTGTAKLDLTLALQPAPDGFAAVAEYSADLFDAATIRRLLGHLHVLLAGIAADPAARLSNLPLLSTEESGQLAAWNAETSSRPRPADLLGSTLHGLFAAQAARTPEAVALIAGEERHSYAGLAARVTALARSLRGLGVGPEVPVGIFLERGAELVVALLATLEAGGFYVPLDPAYPAERVGFMLADSGCAVVLTRTALEAKLPEHRARVVPLDTALDDPPGEPSPEVPAAGSGNLAYVIYTSGSTGRPKAVAIEHRSAVALALWARREFSDLELAGMLASTSITFDMSVFEIFIPLAWGGRVILAENALALPTLPAAAEVRVVDTVPSAIAELLRTGGVPPSVVTVNLGGEPVPRALADRVYAQPGIERLHNVYGPSEDTTFSTWALIERASERSPAIGRPLDGTQGWVVDRDLNPEPVGVPGELYLGGEGLSRGYLGRPELTAERYLPDPFAAAPGARMYRTGDLTRYRPDGSLEFLGRIDHQVKVRGFRVELGEIEAALGALPGVEAAVVLARAEEAAGVRLVACLVPRAGAGLEIAALRESLRARLPDYMLPTAWAVLEALPLTPNGKVDRRALARLAAASEPAAPAGGYVVPQGLAEEQVAVLFAEVLELERVGARDDFFELGGHSLLVTRLLSRVRRLCGVELGVRALFEDPTVEALARRIESAGREARGLEASLAPRSGGGAVPLSFAQQRLWLLDRLQPGSAVYNLPLLFRIEGPLRPATLAAVLGEIGRRHEVLRTVFAVADGEPVQVIRPGASGLETLPVVDLAAFPGPAGATELQRLAAEEAGRPFDLAAGPLARAVLYRLGEGEHALGLDMHHIVSDGWSVGVLARELPALYAAAPAMSAGRPSPLPELPVQYADFALWQRGWLTGQALESQLAFWRGQLAGLPPLELATDRPRPPVQSFRGGVERLPLTTGLADDLRRASQRQGATPFMTFLAAFQALLHRYTGQEDLGVGTPVANRARPETEGLIGFFVNTLVLRADLAGDPPFAELLGRARETALAAFGHQDLPFERLVEELAPERDLSRTPLFQVIFTLHEEEPLELELSPGPSPVVARSEEIAGGTSKFDLSLHVERLAEGWTVAAEYAVDLFDAATVRRLLGGFAVLLGGVRESTATRLSDLPLLTAEEREQLVAGWNRTRTDYPRQATIHELFAERARRAPGAVALVSGEERLTYGELAARAGRLARRLRARGVGPDVPVVLLLERSPEMVIAALAVLAAGGAYVPLDPKDPVDRLRFVLEDCAAPVVVARGALPAGLSTGADLLLLDGPEEIGPAADEAGPGVAAGNLAYVIYTSGSTGRPKGVAIPHRGVARLALGTDYLRIEPGDRVSHLSNPAFDAAVFEVWGALLNGATLVVIPREVALSPGRLAGEVEARGVTVLFLTTALFNLMVREAPWTLAAPRAVLFGGEAVDPAAVRACLETARPARLLHFYGPTEGTVFTTWHPVEAVAPGETVPIGRPVSNTTVHVLDRWRRPVPVGVPGELCTGGDGLARGYLHRPDLTAERFIPDPYADEPGARLYRTGDLARRRPSGEVEFLGRLDTQVKVRGFRIELGEIEAALAGQPGVAAAVALVREDAPGDRRLVAYVVPEAGSEPSASELREALRVRLPESMIPAAFAVLSALPLTPNGKVDRRALAAIDPEPGAPREGFVAPRTPLEARVAEIWREVLDVDRVSAHDSFWDLGGHSLVATRVLARLQDAIGVELPLQALFEHPTPAGLAAAASRLAGESGGGIPRRAGGAPPPLSFAQQRLWLLDRLEPGGSAYNMPFPVRLTGGMDVAVLAAAAGEIARRHEALRTTFAAVDGVPVQVIAPAAPVSLPVIDLAGLPEAAREGEARRLLVAEARTPFDLERGPLLRLALARLAAEEHLLLLDMHHIVSDGWSAGLFFNELSALYAAVAAGEPSPLAEPPIQYADFALWQRAWLQGPALDEQLGYWRERLAGAPPALELPTDRVRPVVQTHRGDVVRHVLPAELTLALRELSRREGASLFMTLLAGFKALLGRLADQEDVVVGSPSAGRRRLETEGLIGFFLNTLVLRTDLSGNPDFRQLLARVKEGVLGAYRYQEVPFEKLLEELHPGRQLSHSPFFQALFNMVNLPAARLEVQGVRIEPVAVPQPGSKFDLTLYVEERDGRIEIDTVYNADLFARSRMEELPRQLECLLAAVAAAPGEPVGALSLVTAAAAQFLPDPSLPLGDGWIGAVHQGLSRSAARFPDRPAVCGPAGEIWSYADLEARSNQLARFLRSEGVGVGDVVAIWARRCPSLVRALMGTLKAGAAFMILDPAYPAERLLEYLRIGRPAAWLGVEGAPLAPPEVASVLPGLGCDTRLELAAGADLLAGFGTADPQVPVGPDDAACLTFTSGSTGRPKGVVGRHGPLSHFYPWLGERFGFSEADRFGMLSALSHDPLQRDVFTPLWFGATLAVPDPDRVGASGYLAGWVRSAGVTALNLTPAMMELVTLSTGELPEGEREMPSLRHAFVVGDLLKKSDVERLQRLAPALACVNFYGSTETQRSISFFEIPRPETAAWADLGHEALPLGRGVEDVQLLVLNRAGRLAGVGEAGEIHLRSHHLALGYLGDPALTAERFLPNPFARVANPSDRVYRTGDLGRYLPDGTVEFAGRADFQVKVRGFRIELGEVEAALTRFPGVRECVVVVREDRPGDRRLAAYLVAAPAPAPRDLHVFLARCLPDYMVPPAFVTLPALPLTRTGKIDRRALPPPAPAVDAGAGAVRELSPVEELLAGLWSELLGRERIGPDDDFFALGGHSLLATRLVSRVRDAFGVELPLRALFETPALEGLAATVERARRDAGSQPPPAIVPLPRDGRRLPLSFAQRRLWFLDQLEPGGSAYNLAGGVLLDGDLDGAALACSLTEIVRRHESLRTTFAAADGEPYAVVTPPAPFSLPRTDLSGLPEERREPEAARLAAADGRRPFDLACGPLLRFTLVRLGERRHALLAAMHHTVSDGWSLGVLVRELSALYPALLAGRPSPLPELPVQYADFALWQREWLRGEALGAQLAWWSGHLAGAPPVLDLPADRSRPAFESHRGGLVVRDLGAGLIGRLEALSRRLGATPFMVLLGAWAVLLARISGEEDVAVGTPIANRGRSELEDLIGFFANTLVLRVDLGALGGSPRFPDLVRQVRESALGAYAHQDLPFERLVEELHPERDLGRSPVFQVTFALQNVPFATLELPGLTLAPLASGRSGRAQFDLDLALVPAAGGLLARLEYSADLFDAATAERMAGHYHNLLAALADSPEQAVWEVSFLSVAERRQLFAEWNDTGPALFGADALRLLDGQPAGAPAVLGGGRPWSHGELAARSAALARRLQGIGVGPEVVVGLCLDRSPEMVAALLGILRAGGAYLPLDLSLPRERLAWMLRDAGAAVLVTRGSLLPDLAGLADALPRVLIDGLEMEETVEEEWEIPDPDPASLAYVLYTSGSTGRPKGVGVSRAALTHHAAAMGRLYGLAPGDRVLQFASLSFDVAAEEIFPTLAAGAAVVLVPDPRELPAEALLDRIEREGLTVLNLPSPYWHEWVSALVAGNRRLPPSLRLVVVGSDKVEPEKLAAWRRLTARQGTAVAWANAYGLTETTVTSTVSGPAVAAAPREGAPVSVGRPVDGARAYVFDSRGELVPAGVPGELWLGGPSLARGYLGRPDLTARAFVPDPFAIPGDPPGSRLFRTGDLARRRPDGEIELLGRADFQVKVRGYRIEPGEVEAALTTHPGVAGAVVLAREDRPGDRRLVAWVAASMGDMAGERPRVADLRLHLQSRLPEYMIPSVFVVLDELPRTANGKVDRRALPAPDARTTGLDRVYAPPRTELERRLAAIWAEILGVDRVGLHDTFWDLGGHSLLATRVVSRLRDALGVELPLRALFEEPTLAGLCRRIAGLRGGEGAPPLVPQPREGALPLSFAQLRLWVLDRFERGSTVYNMPGALRIRGPLRPEALAAALEEIVRRHEILRTVFPRIDGEPVQVVLPFTPGRVPGLLPVVDLGALPAAAREGETARLTAGIRRPFDLAAGPLLRATLVALGGEDHQLLLDMHHIVSDGWSVGVLVRELSALCNALAAGEPAPLPELPVQYADFALWQRQWLASGVLDAQLAYWRGQLAGVPQLELPWDRPRPRVQTFRGAATPAPLSSALAGELERLGRRRGATLFMTLLAAFQTLLHRHSGQEDFAVGTPISGRNRSESEGLIGFFVNTLVLRADLAGDPTFPELLGRVRETALAAYAHQDVFFERLVEELAPERDLSRTPVFQVAFSLQEAELPELDLGPGIAAEGVPLAHRTSKFDLTLDLARAGHEIEGAAEYSTDLFDGETVRRMLGHLSVLLAGIAADPEVRISDLPLMTVEERRQIAAWHGETAVEHPRGDLLHGLFEAQAARTPEAIALIADERRLTYAELERRAEALARRLEALGVGPETAVGLCLSRTADLVAAMLATLKAGGFYVPLDPNYPAERLAFMLEDSGCRVVLAHAAVLGRLPAHGATVVVLDRDDDRQADAATSRTPRLARLVVAGNLAYLIYTSGSTGRPKAVAIEHRSATLLTHWSRRAFTPAELAGVLASTSITFDMSVFEIFATLAWGGTVILADNALALPRLPARGEVTLVDTVPSALAELLAMDALPPSVVTVNLGGEPVPRALADRAYGRPGIERVLNLYGPSEDTTFSTVAVIERTSALPPSIGRPLDRTQAHVVDTRLRPVPVGVPGELLLGGGGLARGYLGRPGLTAERFVPDPFGGEPGARLYRTGDLARRRPDGSLDFLGRIDHQVKIRGFRVEIGEVESALLAQPAVAAAAVAAREYGPGDRRLVAYLVGRGGGIAAAALRRALQERLPEYMVPSVFVELHELPLSPNGKLDRRRLPAPEGSRPDLEEAFAEPRTDLEREVAAIWAEVLSVGRVGLHDNFWSLGGHSLLATKVLARLQAALGIDLPIQTIFNAPTLTEFTAALGQAVLEEQDGDLESLLAEIEGQPFAGVPTAVG